MGKARRNFACVVSLGGVSISERNEKFCLKMQKTPDFSVGWVFASVFIFMAVELFFGGFVGEVILGAYVSEMWHLKAQLLLNLTSFIAGGFLIGVFSPGVRMIEPAIAAFLSVILVGMTSYFLPYPSPP